MQTRPMASAATYSFVILIEGIGVTQLEDVMPEVPASSRSCEAGVWPLAYLLQASISVSEFAREANLPNVTCGTAGKAGQSFQLEVPRACRRRGD